MVQVERLESGEVAVGILISQLASPSSFKVESGRWKGGKESCAHVVRRVHEFQSRVIPQFLYSLARKHNNLANVGVHAVRLLSILFPGINHHLHALLHKLDPDPPCSQFERLFGIVAGKLGPAFASEKICNKDHQ